MKNEESKQNSIWNESRLYQYIQRIESEQMLRSLNDLINDLQQKINNLNRKK